MLPSSFRSLRALCAPTEISSITTRNSQPKMGSYFSKPLTEKGYVKLIIHRSGDKTPEQLEADVQVPSFRDQLEIPGTNTYDLFKSAFAPHLEHLYESRAQQGPPFECVGCGSTANDQSFVSCWLPREDPLTKTLGMSREMWTFCTRVKGDACREYARRLMKENLEQVQKQVAQRHGPDAKVGQKKFTPCCACGKRTLKPQQDFRRCSRCKIAMYCSHECQVADWPKHKKICLPPCKN